MKPLVRPSLAPLPPSRTFRVELPEGHPLGPTTSIVEPDYTSAVFMASLRWPGSVVIR